MKGNTPKKKLLKWILLCSLLAITAILMILSLALSTTVTDILEALPEGTAYLVLILFLMLPIAMIMLIVALAQEMKSARSDTKKSKAQTKTESVLAVEETGNEEESGERVPRFCMLCRIDENKAQYSEKVFDEDVSLKRFCDNFRSFAASELKLYYDISDIRRFIAGLAVSPIIILQGMSGTGKTSLAHAMGAFLENRSTVIPVQPMWKERTDLLGYYNEFTKRFNETLLLEKMYEANYSEEIYITVMDEMNIARVEYYFAEFLSLLELPNPDERYIDVVSDMWDNDPVLLRDGRIKLPPNMWFIGTANNDDSTFAISDKVYDRAMILNLDTKAERFVAPRTKPIHLSAEKFRTLAEEAKREYSVTKRNMKRLEELDKYLIEHFHITFGNRIMKQIQSYIPVYVSCGGEELEALDDILAKKIIRKLETQNPVYLRSAAEGLCNYLDELFGTDAMPICKSAIHRLERNA